MAGKIMHIGGDYRLGFLYRSAAYTFAFILLPRATPLTPYPIFCIDV
jgi:hypothetical protein